MPARPAPTMPMDSFSSLVLPGPFWARAMRLALRNESLPICFLAPSDANASSAVAVAVDERVDEDILGAAALIGDDVMEKELMEDGPY